MEDEELMLNIYKLARSYVGTQNIKPLLVYGYEFEDIVNEIAIYTFGKIKKHYNEEKSKLSTYCYRCNSSKFSMMLREINDYGHKVNMCTISLDKPILENDTATLLDIIANDEPDIMQKCDMDMIYEIINENITPLIKERFFDEMSAKEIAEKHKCTKANIYGLLRKDLDNIKVKIEKQYRN